MKSFSTAAKAAAHETDPPVGPPITFDIDGRQVTALAPTAAQMAVFMSAFAETTEIAVTITDSINFFHDRFQRADATYFKKRLLDPTDPFEFDQVTDILLWLVEEWSGRPTSSPSDSAPSQSNGGPTSTGTPQDKVLIPSAFASTGF